MTERGKSIAAVAIARASGSKVYLGKVCAKHLDERTRWTSNKCCVKCTAEGRKPHLVKNKAALRGKRKAWDEQNPVKAMLQRARRRAKNIGVEFGLVESDVHIPKLCPVLGIELVRRSDDCDVAPSLDRANNSLGYVPGNVVVVSFKANRIKSNATINELRKVVEFYEQNFGVSN